MHRRLRWGNVIRAAGAVLAVAVVVAWPRLAPPEPRLPGTGTMPLGGAAPAVESDEPSRGDVARRDEPAGAGGDRRGNDARRRDEHARRRREGHDRARRGGRDGGARGGRGGGARGGRGDGARRGPGGTTGSGGSGGLVGGGGSDDVAGDGESDKLAGGGGTDEAAGGGREDRGADAPTAPEPAEVEFGFEGG